MEDVLHHIRAWQETGAQSSAEALNIRLLWRILQALDDRAVAVAVEDTPWTNSARGSYRGARQDCILAVSSTMAINSAGWNGFGKNRQVGRTANRSGERADINSTLTAG